MNAFRIEPYKQDVICQDRDTAIAFQSFVRAIPTDSRVKVKAGLYPDASNVGRFKVAVTITRTGLMDGLDAIKAVKDHANALRNGITVYRGERALHVIGG